MTISRRRLFALGGAAAVAPMLPSVAPVADPVAVAEIDAEIEAVWETYRINPTEVIFFDPWRLPNCRCVLTPITIGD